MRMAPAWQVTYDVQARRPNGLTSDSRLTGTRSADWFELVGLPDDNDSIVIARLSIKSWQPYEDDAQSDCLRAARDLCNVLSVKHNNQLAFEPVSPEVERLSGAKDRSGGGGFGLSGSLRGVGIHSIENDHYRLDAAARVHDDPALRADLDTWRQAMIEADGPTRLIHYFRIYEREAQAIVSAEPSLLSDEEVDACAKALADALPSSLEREERERVESAVRRTVGATRKRSRSAILAAHLSGQLKREVTAKQITALDKARGRYAHRASELEARSTAEEELLRDSTLSLLRRTLAAAGEEPGHDAGAGAG